MTTEENLSVTSYALLGQLALRPWSMYEMTKNVGRTLHWFWPRAESVLYAEAKRLATLGLAETASAPGERGQPQTIYSLSPSGRDALARWLAQPAEGFAYHSEPVLRVHLAPYGTKDDLLAALGRAKADADDLLRQAAMIGAEFAAGRHQFQLQVHIRAILFDYLFRFGMTMHTWAAEWQERVAAWPDIDGSDAAREAGRLRIEEDLAAIAGELESAAPYI
jgi:DNA-binding PadR family transcriptional regulator